MKIRKQTEAEAQAARKAAQEQESKTENISLVKKDGTKIKAVLVNGNDVTFGKFSSARGHVEGDKVVFSGLNAGLAVRDLGGSDEMINRMDEGVRSGKKVELKIRWEK